MKINRDIYNMWLWCLYWFSVEMYFHVYQHALSQELMLAPVCRQQELGVTLSAPPRMLLPPPSLTHPLWQGVFGWHALV